MRPFQGPEQVILRDCCLKVPCVLRPVLFDLPRSCLSSDNPSPGFSRVGRVCPLQIWQPLVLVAPGLESEGSFPCPLCFALSSTLSQGHSPKASGAATSLAAHLAMFPCRLSWAVPGRRPVSVAVQSVGQYLEDSVLAVPVTSGPSGSFCWLWSPCVWLPPPWAL